MCLKTILLSRLGRFVPTECHPNVWPSLNLRLGNTVVSTINPGDAHTPIKDYMKNHFYKEAPIPKALALSDGSPRVIAFLEKEMNMYLGSGASIVISTTGDSNTTKSSILGVGLTAMWKRNEEYEVVGANARDWHNTAAVIASDMEHKEDSRLVWRDYQFQHLYDLCQKCMRENGKDYMLWMGCLSYSNEMRSSGFSPKLMALARDAAATSSSKIMLGTQSNFEQSHKLFEVFLKKPGLVDEVSYKEEVLTFRGRRVFQASEDLGSIRFYVDSPS